MTPRQREVLEVFKHRGRKGAAEYLGISVKTVASTIWELRKAGHMIPSSLSISQKRRQARLRRQRAETPIVRPLKLEPEIGAYSLGAKQDQVAIEQTYFELISRHGGIKGMVMG